MPAIVAGARAFAHEARWDHLMPPELARAVAAVIELDFVRVYVADHDGQAVGFLGVTVLPFLWNQALTEMSELFFWVRPGAPRVAALSLLRRALGDIEDEKIDLATFARLPTSSDKVERVYARLGLTLNQTLYQRMFTWE